MSYSGTRPRNGLFKVLSTANYDPEDEVWKFPPDSIVRSEVRQPEGNEFLLAVGPCVIVSAMPGFVNKQGRDQIKTTIKRRIAGTRKMSAMTSCLLCDVEAEDLRHSIIQLHPKLKPTPLTATLNLLAPRTNFETPEQKP